MDAFRALLVPEVENILLFEVPRHVTAMGAFKGFGG